MTDLDGGGHGFVVSVTILSLTRSFWSMVAYLDRWSWVRSGSVRDRWLWVQSPFSHSLGLILAVCHKYDLGVFGLLGFSGYVVFWW